MYSKSTGIPSGSPSEDEDECEGSGSAAGGCWGARSSARVKEKASIVAKGNKLEARDGSLV